MSLKRRNHCKSCDYKKNTDKNYICLIKKGADGLPVMCVGNWTEYKHYYLKRYLDIVVKGVAKKWGGNIIYIDLFCGPGRCILRETGTEIDGSPLIALSHKLVRYIFVDIEKEIIKILKRRCKSQVNYNQIEFIKSDCNEAIKEIRKFIPKNSLAIAFIDPTGLHFKFESYRKLTKDRNIDLIINFPIGAIKRNIKKGNYKRLDSFLGGEGWRKPVINTSTKYLTNYFKENLKEIGYRKHDLKGGDVLIRTTKKKLPIYNLLYASKHDRGIDFWKKIKKYDHMGQQALF